VFLFVGFFFSTSVPCFSISGFFQTRFCVSLHLFFLKQRSVFFYISFSQVGFSVFLQKFFSPNRVLCFSASVFFSQTRSRVFLHQFFLRQSSVFFYISFSQVGFSVFLHKFFSPNRVLCFSRSVFFSQTRFHISLH
jgi:hypothetical protein